MKRKPAHGTCHLVLVINDTEYTLRILQPDKRIANPAYRLTKSDGTEYTVHCDEFCASCTCADFVYAREHKDERGCKHCCALRAVFLLPPLPQEDMPP